MIVNIQPRFQLGWVLTITYPPPKGSIILRCCYSLSREDVFLSFPSSSLAGRGCKRLFSQIFFLLISSRPLVMGGSAAPPGTKESRMFCEIVRDFFQKKTLLSMSSTPLVVGDTTTSTGTKSFRVFCEVVLKFLPEPFFLM